MPGYWLVSNEIAQTCMAQNEGKREGGREGGRDSDSRVEITGRCSTQCTTHRAVEHTR